MTPEKKARDLLALMAIDEEIRGSVEFGEAWSVPANKYAKECALRAVDEILNNNIKIPGIIGIHLDANTEFWQNVKQELNKM